MGVEETEWMLFMDLIFKDSARGDGSSVVPTKAK